MTKEEIYDEAIHPLMVKVLAVCQQHRIPMVASFGIGTEADQGLHCTSILLTRECAPSPQLLRMAKSIYPPSRPVMFVNERDEEGKLTRSTAIVV